MQIDVGEGDLQQEREDERRHRETEEADPREHVVEDRVLADRRVDADGHAEHERKDLRDHDELERVAERPMDLRPERLQRGQRRAELVREHVVEPVEVANDHRLVEVLLDDDVLDRARRNPGIRLQKPDRVPSVRDEHEAEKRGEKQDGNAVENPSSDVREHGVSPPGRGENGDPRRPLGERGSHVVRQSMIPCFKSAAAYQCHCSMFQVGPSLVGLFALEAPLSAFL